LKPMQFKIKNLQTNRPVRNRILSLIPSVISSPQIAHKHQQVKPSKTSIESFSVH
jgi:hypothetical protein